MAKWDKVLVDSLKVLIPGAILALLVGGAMSVVGGLGSLGQIATLFIWGVLALVGLAWVPRRYDTAAELIPVTFFISGFAGLLTFLVPMLGPIFGWTSATDLGLWVRMLVIALLAIGVSAKIGLIDKRD